MQHAIKHAKKSFYDAKIKKLKDTNANRWWKEVKNLSGLIDTKGQWYQKFIDGDTIDTTDELCEKINEFFVGLTSEFVPLVTEDVSNITVQNIPDELFVTNWEAYNSLRGLKIKKAPGPDGIPTVLLRNNLTENALGTRPERVSKCVPFAFHLRSIRVPFAFHLRSIRVPFAFQSVPICVPLSVERIQKRVPVTLVISSNIIGKYRDC